MASSDIFYQFEARNLLKNRQIYFFGDSNVRALYKDLIWLLENGSLIPQAALRRKNEQQFSQDVRVSNAPCTNSLLYEEVRRYVRNGAFLKFEFLTRVFQERLKLAVAKIKSPSLLVINSCLWDISRYGPSSIDEFKQNLVEMIKYIRKRLPAVKILWITTLPPSPKCRGGFLNDDIKYLQSLLPFHVIQANNFVTTTLKAYDVDILDLHYHLKFLIDFRSSDGVHWSPTAVRFITNLFLTHISICWGKSLPGRVILGGKYGILNNLPKDIPCIHETKQNRDKRPFRKAFKNVNGNIDRKRRRNYKGRVANITINKENVVINIDFTKDLIF